MYHFKHIILTTIIAIGLLLSIPYLLSVLGLIFVPARGSVLSQLSLYQWTAIGALGFCIVYRYMKKNKEWAETFSHELTHTVFAILFQGRILDFKAGEGSGVMSHSGVNKWGHIIVALAPYCFPLFTYLLLTIRHLIGINGRWVFDILVGITLAFHVTCFKKQIGNHQTDINSHPLWFSYFYIASCWVFNLIILLVTFFPNMYKVSSAHWYYGYGLWSSVARWFNEMWNTLFSLF